MAAVSACAELLVQTSVDTVISRLAGPALLNDPAVQAYR